MCLGTILNLQVAPFPGYPEETPRFAPLKSPPGLECTEEVGNLIMLELPKIVLLQVGQVGDDSFGGDFPGEGEADSSREVRISSFPLKLP